jgi:hypothetical protein
MKRIFLLLITTLVISIPFSKASAVDSKKVLIVTEGTYDIKMPATAEALQLCNLLGHFKTTYTVIG